MDEDWEGNQLQWWFSQRQLNGTWNDHVWFFTVICDYLSEI
jgi:hypothetical protein